MSNTATLDPVFGCALFSGRKTTSGYGRSGKVGAHVVAWERAFGPVPSGFVLDHLCKQRDCVALHHLEAVTQAENLLRRSLRYRSRRAHCAQGHDLRVNRVVTPAGGFVCRTCNREAKSEVLQA